MTEGQKAPAADRRGRLQKASELAQALALDAPP